MFAGVEKTDLLRPRMFSLLASILAMSDSPIQPGPSNAAVDLAWSYSRGAAWSAMKNIHGAEAAVPDLLIYRSVGI